MWSYNGPSSGLKDQVRFLVGDTKAKDPYLQDEEIAFLLLQAGQDPSLAAVHACERIISQLARSRDESVGSVSISFSQAFAGYQVLLESLKVQLVLSGAIVPFAGGISRASKELARRDTDWERPDFSHNMMRSPWARPLLDLQPSVDWSQYPIQ